jgi:hypothetical protein
MSIFEMVGDMFKQLIAIVVFFVLLGLGAVAVVAVMAGLFYLHEGHL